MDKYELAVVLDASLPQDQKDSIIKETGETITKSGGKVINNQVWIDKHRFSFRMDKCSEGTYYLVNFEGPRASVSPIQQSLRLNERILRFLVTNAK